MGFLKKMDYLFILAIIFLSLFGLLMIFSSSYPLAILNLHPPKYFFAKQLHFFGIGMVLFAIACIFPFRVYGKLSPILVNVSRYSYKVRVKKKYQVI